MFRNKNGIVCKSNKIYPSIPGLYPRKKHFLALRSSFELKQRQKQDNQTA